MMKILLLGECSHVHFMLAEGLRKLGHEVTLAPSGASWKGYPGDLILSRTLTPLGTLSFLWRLIKAVPKMRGYDIVQVNNPIFFELKAEKHFTLYRYLRRHNKKIVLCCFGIDYYYAYINSSMMPMRYSDYNYGKAFKCVPGAQILYDMWVGTAKESLNRHIAADCDAIIAGAYENWLPIMLTSDKAKDGTSLKEKLYSIPLPFKLQQQVHPQPSEKLRVFIGFSRNRSQYKGTDIMLQAAMDLKEKHPEKIELKLTEEVPYAEYQHMIDGSDVLMDQIYSYGPGMNALLALSKGIVCMSGAEPEHYDLLGETECRPIVNVQPTYESVYSELEKLILMPKDELQKLKDLSREYVLRNHEYIKVAEKYVKVYSSLLIQ